MTYDSVMSEVLAEISPGVDITQWGGKVPKKYKSLIKKARILYEDRIEKMFYGDYLEGAFNRAFKDANVQLKKLGLSLPVRRQEFKDYFSDEFLSKRFKKKSFKNRVVFNGAIFEKSITDTFSFSAIRGKSTEELMESLGRKLFRRGSYSGASPKAMMERLIVGENHRAYWDGIVELAYQGGAEYLKYVLNPNHPDYNYLEICEEYAAETDPKKTGQSGLGPGVYRVDLFPKMAHPHCGCRPAIMGGN